MHDEIHIYFLTDFLFDNLTDFKEERNFIDLFQLADIKRISSDSTSNDQTRILKLLDERRYLHAFLKFVTFTDQVYPTGFYENSDLAGLTAVLTTAKSLDEHYKQHSAVEAVIRHTSFHKYHRAFSQCHLGKMIETYAFFRESPFLENYLSLMFELAADQCKPDEWDTFIFISTSIIPKYHSFFCFITNNTKWHTRLKQTVSEEYYDRLERKISCS